MMASFEYIDFAWRKNNGYFGRKVAHLSRLPSLMSAHGNDETFSSVFIYPQEIMSYAEGNKVNGHPSISSYGGPVFANIGPACDIDTDNGLDKALVTSRELFEYFTDRLRIPCESVALFFSGDKGFHLYPDARVWGAEPSRYLNRIFKALRGIMVKNAKLTYPETVDRSCTSKTALLRLPGSIHFKSGLYKTQISPDELYDFSIDDIREKARHRQKNLPFLDETGLIFDHVEVIPKAKGLYQYARRKMRHRPARKPVIRTGAKEDLCAAIRTMLNSSFRCGERDQAALRIVSALNLNSYPEEEAQDLMLSWNKGNQQNGAPFPDRELLGLIRYIYQRKKGGYNFSCIDDLIRRHCPFSDKRKCPSRR
jgi:hypothetical protein